MPYNRDLKKNKTKRKNIACLSVFVSITMCTRFFVLLLSIVSRPYANQSLLEGLWLGGGGNTAQYCFLSPHVQPRNEAASPLLSVCFVTTVDFYVRSQSVKSFRLCHGAS